jgi:hypothetical protein
MMQNEDASQHAKAALQKEKLAAHLDNLKVR